MKVLLLNKVENIVTKGEIANYEQSTLLSECLQKTYAKDYTVKKRKIIALKYIGTAEA